MTYNVLVVDERPEYLDRVSSMIKNLGLNAIPIADSDKALDTIRENSGLEGRIDLVLATDNIGNKNPSLFLDRLLVSDPMLGVILQGRPSLEELAKIFRLGISTYIAEELTDFVLSEAIEHSMGLVKKKRGNLGGHLGALSGNLHKMDDYQDNPSELDRARFKAYKDAQAILETLKSSRLIVSDGSLTRFERFIYEVTEGGAYFTKTDPDTSDGQQMILKEVTAQRARQTIIDTSFLEPFRQSGDFVTEKIYADLYPKDSSKKHILVKEAIKGPNLSYILSLLNNFDGDESSMNEEQKMLLSSEKRTALREHLYDLMFERIYFWQHRVGLSEETRKPDDIINPMMANITNTLHVINAHTDVNLSGEEIALYEKGVEFYGWNDFIKQDTIKRNLAATWRNVILDVGDFRPTLESAMRDVHRGQHIGKKKLAEKFVHIDLPHKNSFMLEDYIEAADSLEGGLREDEKECRFEKVIERHDPYISSLLKRGLNPMRIYRSLRRIFFFLGTFGQNTHHLSIDGKISDKEYIKKSQFYHENAYYHFDVLSIVMDKMIDGRIKISEESFMNNKKYRDSSSSIKDDLVDLYRSINEINTSTNYDFNKCRAMMGMVEDIKAQNGMSGTNKEFFDILLPLAHFVYHKKLYQKMSQFSTTRYTIGK